MFLQGIVFTPITLTRTTGSQFHMEPQNGEPTRAGIPMTPLAIRITTQVDCDSSTQGQHDSSSDSKLRHMESGEKVIAIGSDSPPNVVGTEISV